MPTECPLVALRRNRKISHSAEHLDLSRYVHGPHSCEPALRQRGYRRVALPSEELRPSCAHALPVVPLPAYGSHTSSPESEKSATSSRRSSSGFCAGWHRTWSAVIVCQ
jgi:hypothetical protein